MKAIQSTLILTVMMTGEHLAVNYAGIVVEETAGIARESWPVQVGVTVAYSAFAGLPFLLTTSHIHFHSDWAVSGLRNNQLVFDRGFHSCHSIGLRVRFPYRDSRLSGGNSRRGNPL